MFLYSNSKDSYTNVKSIPFDNEKDIQNIVEKHQIKTAVKSKSMITEEVELNTFLELLQVDVLESDLGEFIVQLRGESPYHIVTPAMHLSKEQVIDLYLSLIHI